MPNDETREKEQLTRKRDYWVAMSNVVIDEMRIGLSAQQQDMLDFMLKEIRGEDKPDKRYSVTIHDFCRVNNITDRAGSKNHKDIKRALKELNNNCKWIEVEKNKSKLVYWFSNIEVDGDKGVIEYNIDITMRQYLFDLIKEGNYTEWRYRHKAALSSKYAKLLYVMMLRYYNAGITKPFIPLDKLKTLLNAETYDRFPDFRRYVLEAAIKEINSKTLINVSYDPYKAKGSRAITHIDFEIKQIEYFSNEGRARVEANHLTFGEEEYLLPF